MGVKVSRESEEITVSSEGNLIGAGEIDCSDCPDVVPTVCAVAACAQGTTKIVNVGHLRAKESDRITDLVAELKKFGCYATEGPDWILINGKGIEALHGATVATHNDHRLAMSLAVLGMAIGKTTILGAECVSKSFPDFFEQLETIGANIDRTNKDDVKNGVPGDERNIVLIGFMGTGKSEVGKAIAKATGRKLVELDSEIEKSAGMKIPEIFEAEGEAGFRRREAAECAKAAQKTGCVISCGGGVVLDNRNVAALKKNGRLYWLKATPESIWERVSANAESRPLLKDGGIGRVRTLLASREGLYAGAADYCVDTASKGVAEIANEVLLLCAASKTVKC